MERKKKVRVCRWAGILCCEDASLGVKCILCFVLAFKVRRKATLQELGERSSWDVPINWCSQGGRSG